jgi:diguanylate cyclase (GGDEF)-like protein
VKEEKMKEFYYDTTTPLRRNYILSSPLVIAVIVFFLAAAFATWIIWQLEQDRLKIARVRAYEIASSYADAIRHANESSFAITLSQLEKQGFSYELWRVHSDTKQKEIIVASTPNLMGDPVERTVQVSNITWILSVTPINGWDDPYGLSLKMLTGLIFSILVAWLAKLIIDLKRYKAELECLAFFDMLTGLPNRRLLYDRLNQAIAQSKRDKKIVAVCYLDLDNFKVINDTLGHESGDCLLIEVTKRFRSCLREQDTLARIGGDEFVLLLQNLEETNHYKVVLERILKAAADPIVLGDKNVMASISIGVTLYPQDASDPATLLQHADEAMYQAKRDGKGKICLFDKENSTFKKC